MSIQHSQLVAVAMTLLACGKQPSGEPPKLESSAPLAIGTGDWVLVSLGTQTMPADSTKRPTLRLDTGTLHASGFAGCNRYSGTFILRGDSLTFGPVVSTKMFCEATSELETAFLKALGATATYQVRTWSPIAGDEAKPGFTPSQVNNSELLLRTRDGQEARFKPASK
jgi:heat shock protein HslJ